MKRIISVLRHTSIKRRLECLFGIQLIVLILLEIMMTYSSFNRMAHQVRLTGQQLLYSASTEMTDIYSELTVLTKYPAITTNYGSTQIYSYLTSGGIGGHTAVEYMQLQYELSSQIMLHPSVSILGFTDLNGMAIYCDEDEPYYRLSVYNTQSKEYQSIVNLKGSCQILSAEEMKSFIPNIYTQTPCLYGARAIMKLNHLECVGVIFCRIETDSIREAFETNQLYTEQNLTLWSKNGQLLYGNGDCAVDFKSAQKNTVTIYWHKENGTFNLYQVYQAEGGIIAVLTTPLPCFLRGMSLYLFWLLLLPILMIIVLVFSRLLVRSIREPIDRLMEMCKRIQVQDFSMLSDENACDEMHDLISSFNAMCADIQKLIEEVYEKNLLQAQTEMQLIRSQINPHFVYNTLEVIRAESYSRGQTDIADMTTLLGKTLRYGITRQSASVTVEQEMFHLQDYIALQQMHFQDRMQIYINVDPQMYPCYMLRLVLQPLVENAIHHGQPSNGRQTTIRILGFLEDNDMVFTISDDGPGIPPEQLELLQGYIEGRNEAFSSIGLRNTHLRLTLRYGNGYGLKIRSVFEKGTVVTVRMPCRMLPFNEDEKGEPA